MKRPRALEEKIYMSTTSTVQNHRGEAIAAAAKAASGPRPRRIGVMLVEDDRCASYSLWALLNWQPGIRVLGTAHIADAVPAIQRERPAVCLVSAAAGPRCYHRLSQLPTGPAVLVYADHPSAELDATAAIAGADGVLWRYGDPEQLVETIRRVADKRHRPQDLGGEAICRIVDRVEDRDRPIAAMLLQRIAPDEIARTLGISAGGLRARRRRIVRRLEQAGFGASAVRLRTSE